MHDKHLIMPIFWNDFRRQGVGQCCVRSHAEKKSPVEPGPSRYGDSFPDYPATHGDLWPTFTLMDMSRRTAVKIQLSLGAGSLSCHPGGQMNHNKKRKFKKKKREKRKRKKNVTVGRENDESSQPRHGCRIKGHKPKEWTCAECP